MFRFLRDRAAWKKAQRTHELEHETSQPLTLTCDAVGHVYSQPYIDSYFDLFDHDLRRKFCVAAGRKWSHV